MTIACISLLHISLFVIQDHGNNIFFIYIEIGVWLLCPKLTPLNATRTSGNVVRHVLRSGVHSISLA